MTAEHHVTPEQHIFGVIVHSREKLAYDNSIMTPEGARFWVTIEPEGWVEASSQRVAQDNEVPIGVKTFTTRRAAGLFARRWQGHPWWCAPNGTYEIVELIPRKVIEARVTGYEVFRE